MANSNQGFYNIKILRICNEYLKNELQWNDNLLKKIYKKIGINHSLLKSGKNWFNQDIADKFYFEIEKRSSIKNLSYKIGSFIAQKAFKELLQNLLLGYFPLTLHIKL